MSTFVTKCPGCGILFEADEDDVGTDVECSECGRAFILARDPNPSSAGIANDTVTFTFDAFPRDLDYSQPLSLTMPNGSFPVKYWSEVLEHCYAYAFQNNRGKIESLADIEAPPPLRKGILFSRHPEILRQAKELSPGFYMEANFSAHSVVKNVCGLMAYCEFPLKEFSVTYRAKSSALPVPEGKADVPVPKICVQKNWIRFDFTNAPSFERTVPAYCSIDGHVIEGKNWARILVALVEFELAKGNPALEDLYEKPLYANRANRPFLMKEKIEGGHNCSKLSNGHWIDVNWSIPRLMEIIQTLLIHCGHDKTQISVYGVPKADKPATHERSQTKKSEAHGIDMKKAEAFLKTVGLQGATVQELIDAVQPRAAFWPTKNTLDENLNVIAMPDNRYVHAESFVDLDEAEDALGKILSTHFARFGGYSNNQLLFGAASQELSMFLNDNDCENINVVYAIARYLFEKKAAEGKKYKFAPPHIFVTEPDHPMNLKGLMIRLARSNGGVLYEVDAKDYLQKAMLTYGSIGQLLQIKSDNTFLVYDSGRYLLSEVLGIDDVWCRQIHDRMDDLFRKADVAYVIPRDISETWFSTLPVLPLGLAWTPLLLQEILDKYPAIGFQSISADLNQAFHTLAAAFVPKDSPLQSFPDVVTLFMEEHHELPIRMSGEELRKELRDKGMLEAGEMIYSLHKALDDYRFAWTDENKTVLIRGNK